MLLHMVLIVAIYAAQETRNNCFASALDISFISLIFAAAKTTSPCNSTAPLPVPLDRLPNLASRVPTVRAIRTVYEVQNRLGAESSRTILHISLIPTTVVHTLRGKVLIDYSS